MTVAIGFYSGDVDAARRLLEFIGDLGGCFGHTCLLIADAETNWADALECKRLADMSFDSCELITNVLSVSGWIQGSNSLFKSAAIRCAGQPFFWLEPDCVPLKSGWMDHIQTAYKQCKKAFMGALVSHQLPGWPNPYLEGPAVYPANCWKLFEPVWNPNESWTRATSKVSVPSAVDTPLIHQLWGENNDPPKFDEHGIRGTSTFGLDFIRKGAVLFHRTKDGSLIRLLRKKRGIPDYTHDTERPTFCHGGDVGDVIHGLCAVKAMGGGNMLLVRHSVREAFNPAKASLLLPLLRIQPYIDNADFLDGDMVPLGNSDCPAWVDHNLNMFRPLQHHLRHNGTIESIAETHLRLLGLDLSYANGAPWISVDQAVEVAGKSVVFHRSDRYNNPKFPWKRIYAKYGKTACFVGTPNEHRQFQSTFGQITYHHTPSLLDLARVIAGCKLFVGNQSAPYAIAEGMKQNAILECCEWVPDCVYKRKNLIVGRDDSIKLPSV